MLHLIALLSTMPAIPLLIGGDTSTTAAVTLNAHVFLSQGLIWSSGANYIVESKRPNPDFTEVGLNVVGEIPDHDVRFGAQLFTRRLGTDGTFPARFDWFYGDWTPMNEFGVRIGRIKLPYGLYNDSSDIDSARATILLPQSMYPIKNRDFLLALHGIEVHGILRNGARSFFSAVEYRAYAGSVAYTTADVTVASGIAGLRVDTPYVAGGRVVLDALPGLRLAGSVQALRLDLDFTFQTMPIGAQIPAVLWVASAEYTFDALKVAAEYSRWHTRLRSDSELLPPERVTSERAYGLVSYTVTDWLQPAAYASILFPDTHVRKGRDAYQLDLAAALRFDLTPFWLIKVEGHYMRGTADVDPILNGGVPANAFPRDWVVGLAKTTMYF